MSVDLPINPSTRGPETFTATAGQTAFTGSYPVQEAADIVVETSLDAGATWMQKTLGIDYTVTIAPAPTPGFTVIFAAARADGEKVRHYGKQVLKNTTDFSPANTLKPAGLNAKLDRLTMADQEFARESGRALKVPLGQTGPSLTVGAAGEVLMFDAAGNVVPGPDGGDIEAAQGYAAQAQDALNDAIAARDAAQAARDEFKAVYYGAAATVPSTDPLGNAPTAGDLYFDTSTNTLQTWTGAAWVAVGTGTATSQAVTHTPTDGEDPVALSLFAILSERVRVENYIPAGATDHTDAIRRAAAVIADAGKGVLVFKHGATYTVFSDLAALGTITTVPDSGYNKATPLASWINLTRAAAVEGNGAKLYAPTVDDGVTYPAYGIHLFWLQGTQGVTIEDLTYEQAHTPLSPSAQASFVTIGGGARRTAVRGVTMIGGTKLIHGTGGPAAANYGMPPGGLVGLTLERLKTHTVYYPMNFQFECHGVTATKIETVNAGRSYFPYNCRGHTIELVSQQGGPFDDCLLKVYTGMPLDADNVLSDITITYRTPGRYPGSGNTAAHNAIFALEVQQWNATSRRGEIRDIHINMEVSDTQFEHYANIVRISKFDKDGNPDTAMRNNRWQDITFRGKVYNWNSNNNTADGIPSFLTHPAPALGYNFTGDTISGLNFEKLFISGLTPPQIKIDGINGGTIRGVRFRDIVSEGNLITSNLPNGALDIQDNIQFANVQDKAISTSGLSYVRRGSVVHVFGQVSHGGSGTQNFSLPGAVALTSWLKINVSTLGTGGDANPSVAPVNATTFSITASVANTFYVDIIGL